MSKFAFLALLLSFAPLAHAKDDRPLQLKYTAVDGSQVDLARMRGKIVLLDFWATWCGDCRLDAPDVVAVYNKFHAQGLEIVGVSLDKHKEKLLAFTKEHGMVWPQYFDGKGWDNEISQRFGIREIPTIWLIGRDGRVISKDVDTHVGWWVKKALAGP